MPDPRLCSRCGNDFDEKCPIESPATGRTQWLCTACACGNHVLGQETEIVMRGPPNATPWRDVEAVAVMFSTEPEWREHRPDARFEFHEQWFRTEKIMLAAGIASFHPLFVFEDTPPIELAFVLMQCRRFDTPLIVSDVALLPYGTSLDGLHLIASYRVSGGAA